MMNKNLVYILVTAIYIIGCGKPAPNIEECLQIAKLSPVKKYKIVRSDTSWAIGDYSLNHTLIISREDYLRLVKEIKSKPYYVEYDMPSSIKHARINANRMDLKIVEVAYSVHNETYYEYFNSKTWDEIGISLQQDSILYVGFYND